RRREDPAELSTRPPRMGRPARLSGSRRPRVPLVIARPSHLLRLARRHRQPTSREYPFWCPFPRRSNRNALSRTPPPAILGEATLTPRERRLPPATVGERRGTPDLGRSPTRRGCRVDGSFHCPRRPQRF